MDITRFRKAAQYLRDGSVKLEYKGDALFAFRIGQHEPKLLARGGAKCTCAHEVYDNEQRRACAHVIAAHAFLAMRLLMPSEQKAVLEAAQA